MPYFTYWSVSGFNYGLTIIETPVLAQNYNHNAPERGWHTKEDTLNLIEIETLEDLLILSMRTGQDIIINAVPRGPGIKGDNSPWEEPFRGIDGWPIEDIAGSIIIYDGYIE